MNSIYFSNMKTLYNVIAGFKSDVYFPGLILESKAALVYVEWEAGYCYQFCINSVSILASLPV